MLFSSRWIQAPFPAPTYLVWWWLTNINNSNSRSSRRFSLLLCSEGASWSIGTERHLYARYPYLYNTDKNGKIKKKSDIFSCCSITHKIKGNNLSLLTVWVIGFLKVINISKILSSPSKFKIIAFYR